MSCDGSSEKEISVVLEKLSVTSSDPTSSQRKNDSEYPPPVQSQILSVIQKIRRSKNLADVKAITEKITKTKGTIFDEGYIAFNISQLLGKKIITNVKIPQHLDFFFAFPPQKLLRKIIYLDRWKKFVLDDTLCNASKTFIS